VRLTLGDAEPGGRPPPAFEKSWAAMAGYLADCNPAGGLPGALRARSHCRFAPPLILFIPDSLKYSVQLLLKRQCDRTLGAPHPAPAELRALCNGGLLAAASHGDWTKVAPASLVGCLPAVWWC
jgi:hypothetical protein